MFSLPRLRVSYLATIVALAGTCVYLKALTKTEMRFAASALEVVKCDDWRKPSQFDEAWEQVSFSAACAVHESCYHAAGASWSACNQRYLKDLRGACDQAFASSTPSLAVCYDMADQYFSRVQRPVALRKFQKAQELVAVAGDAALDLETAPPGGESILVRRNGE